MRRNDKSLINFLKSVSTSTQGLEFAAEETLDGLHPAMAAHIEELEDLLCRLSCEAEALLWRMGIGHELYKRGK